MRVMDQKRAEVLDQAMEECGWNEGDVDDLAVVGNLKKVWQLIRGEALLLPLCGPGPVGLDPAPAATPAASDSALEIEEETYRVSVYPSRTLDELIAAGRYVTVSSDITNGKFGSSIRGGEINLILVNFKKKKLTIRKLLC